MNELTESERTELLDWVSACQSSYHIDSTPGHRFGGLGSHLQENRDALVEYVNDLLAARTQPAQEVPRLTNDEIKKITGASDEYWANSQLFIIAISRATEAALMAKMQKAQ